MMMKKGSLLSILMSFFSVTLGHAQIIETIAPLGTDISKNEINQNLESENSEQSIDGIHFYSLTRSFNTNKFCSSLPASEVPIKETKEPKFEILLITENPVVEKTGVTLNQSFKNYNYKNNVKLYSDMLPNELNTQEINTVANYVYNHSSPPQNANDIQVAKDAVFIEALIQTIPKVQYSNEATLTGQISKVMNDYSNGDEETKYRLLNLLSNNFYQTYNNSRNPFSNSLPDGTVPNSAISVYDLFIASANNDVNKSGNCNDISETIAKIATNIFPDKDILTLTSGAHFGVLIADDNERRVIDSNDQLSLAGQLALMPDSISNQVRVSKIENGRLKEIAVVDSQLGTFVNKAFDYTIPGLKTGADFRNIILQTKNTWNKSDEKFTSLLLNAGQANLYDSNVQIVVAKIESETEKSNFYIGTGADVQIFKNSDRNTMFHIHFKTGYDRRLIHYVNPKVEVSFESGIHINGSAGFDRTGLETNSISGGLSTVNQLHIKNKPHTPRGWQWNGTLLSEHTLGSPNWGKSTGAISKGINLNTFQSLGFHLNQVYAEGTAIKPIHKNNTLVFNSAYQGSAVGQTFKGTLGYEIKSKKGAKIYFYSGYEKNDFKGYKTKFGYLDGPSGGKTGVRYQSASGRLEIDNSAANLKAGSTPEFNTTIKLMLDKKKKKKVKID